MTLRSSRIATAGDPLIGGVGDGVALVGHEPTHGNRCVDHDGHQYLCPSWRAERISSSGMRGIVLRNSSISDATRSISGLAAIGLRDDSGNRLAVPRDHDGFATLDRIEQARQTRFSFGRLDFAHADPHRLVGQFDWSNIARRE